MADLKDLAVLKKRVNLTGNYIEDNSPGIVPTGTLKVTENRDNINIKKYANINVNVPNPSTGTISVTENGIVDVTDYEYISVNVPNPSTGSISATENDRYDVSEKASINVNVSDSIYPYVPAKDVNLYDYDGTRLYSYTKEEFLGLSSLPSNVPTHDILDLGQWNWDIYEARNIVQNTDQLMIGRARDPKDNKTHLFIHVTEDTLNLKLYFTIAGSNNHVSRDWFSIDWGDQSPITTITGLYNYYAQEMDFREHTYSNPGDYHVVLNLITYMEDTVKLGGEDDNYYYNIIGMKYDKNLEAITSDTEKYMYTLQKFYLGHYFVPRSYTLYECRSLKEVSLPNGGSPYAIFPNDFCYINLDNLNNINILTIVIPYRFNRIATKNTCKMILPKLTFSNDGALPMHLGISSYASGSILNDDNGTLILPVSTGKSISTITKKIMFPEIHDVYLYLNGETSTDSYITMYRTRIDNNLNLCDVTFHVPRTLRSWYSSDSNWQNYNIVYY